MARLGARLIRLLDDGDAVYPIERLRIDALLAQLDRDYSLTNQPNCLFTDGVHHVLETSLLNCLAIEDQLYPVNCNMLTQVVSRQLVGSEYVNACEECSSNHEVCRLYILSTRKEERASIAVLICVPIDIGSQGFSMTSFAPMTKSSARLATLTQAVMEILETLSKLGISQFCLA